MTRDEENAVIAEALVEAGRFNEAVALWENEYGPEMAGQLIAALYDEGYIGDTELTEIAGPALEADEEALDEADLLEAHAGLLEEIAEEREQEAAEAVYEEALDQAAERVEALGLPFSPDLFNAELAAAGGDVDAATAAYIDAMRGDAAVERPQVREAYLTAAGDEEVAEAAYEAWRDEAEATRREAKVAATKASFRDQPQAGTLDDAIADLHAEVLVDAAAKKAQARPQGGSIGDAVDDAL